MQQQLESEQSSLGKATAITYHVSITAGNRQGTTIPLQRLAGRLQREEHVVGGACAKLPASSSTPHPQLWHPKPRCEESMSMRGTD